MFGLCKPSSLRMLSTLPSDNTVYIPIPTCTGTEPGTAYNLCVYAQVTCTCIIRGYDIPSL